MEVLGQMKKRTCSCVRYVFSSFLLLGEGGIFDNIGRVGVTINGKPLKSTGHSQLFCSLILIPAVYIQVFVTK
jgi:hypothetical protein